MTISDLSPEMAWSILNAKQQQQLVTYICASKEWEETKKNHLMGQENRISKPRIPTARKKNSNRGSAER